MKLWSLFLASGLLNFVAHATETIPPAPTAYVVDEAHVLSPATADALNRQLESFERATTNQIIVALYPHMLSDTSIEDYTVRVAQAWGVGQKDRKNGAVLFVFVQSHQLYLQVGYGLEGVLPDITAKRIIEDEIKPHLRQGDFDGGMRAGVTAILQATRGEYQGSGRTRADKNHAGGGIVSQLVVLFLVLGFIWIAGRSSSSGSVFQSNGRSSYGGWGGGNFSGESGRSGRGSGGGFSGGGGSFGGGGAGGSW